MEKQRRTFISYSRANKDFAIKLAKELKTEGFQVWLDMLDIPPGSRWDVEVEKALEECEIFMIIMTPASIASENVRDEIGYAIDNGKRFLPVLLENCTVPLRLRRFQYVDFTNKNFDDGVESAKELLRSLIAQVTVPRQELASETQAQAAQEEERKAKEDAERISAQKAEEERIALAKLEAEQKEKEEVERLATQKAEEERLAKAKIEAERLATQKAEEERIAKAKVEAERKAKEDAQRLALQKAEEKRLAKAKAEAEQKEKEDAKRLAAQKVEEERAAQARAEADRFAKEEAARLAAQKAEEQRASKIKAETEQKAKQEAERLAALKAAEEKAAKAKREQELEKQRSLSDASLPKQSPTTQVPVAKKSRMPVFIGIGAGAIAVLAVFAFLAASLFFKPGDPGTNNAAFVSTELTADAVSQESIPVSGPSTPTVIPSTATKSPTKTPMPTATPGAQEYFTEKFQGDYERNWSYFLRSGDAQKFSLTNSSDGLLFELTDMRIFSYLVYEPFEYEEVRVDATVENLGVNDNNVTLFCRYSPEHGWYEFNIYSSGLYDMYFTRPDSQGNLNYGQIAEGGSTKINMGKATNQYSIICGRDNLTLYINGFETRTIALPSYVLDKGKVGVSVSSFDQLPVQVMFKEVKISRP